MDPVPDNLLARVFDAWVQVMLRHRLAVLAWIALVTAMLAWKASQLPIVTTLMDLLPEDTPGYAEYRVAEERFGGDEVVFLGLEADDHFTEPGLARLRRLTDALAAHPLVERTISPLTLDEIRPDPDDPAGGLLVEPYAREGRTAEEIGRALLRDDLVRGSLVSVDAHLVMVGAQLLPNTDAAGSRPELRAEFDRRIAAIPGLQRFIELGDADADGHRGSAARRLEIAKQVAAGELIDLAVEAGFPRERVHPTGFSVVLLYLLSEGTRNMKVLFPITVLLIAASLLWLLRRPLDVVLPLICVGPAIIWAMALGGLAFGRLSIISTICPVMVLVVGVSDVIHLVTQFRHELARGRPRDEAIRVVFRQVGAACVLTSVTTFIGFGSMWFLPLPPSRELGLFAGLGVIAAFILSFMLVPVFLSFTHPAPPRDPERQVGAALARSLAWLADRVALHSRALTVGGCVLTAVTVFLALRVEVENGLTEKLAPDHPVRRSVAIISEHLGGGGQMELLIDAGAPDGLKDPAVVAALAELRRRMGTLPRVGVVTSYVDVLERIHRIMDPGGAGLPASRELIAQYLLLFEMSGGRDLDSLLDATGRHARAIVRIGDMSAEEGIAMAAQVDAWAAELLPAPATASMNGIGLLAARFGPRAQRMSLQGFAMANALIAVLMAMLFGSAKVGLMSLLPNVLPVALGLVLVAALYEQVDLDTVNFLSICIGLAVDDTIHYLARFRIEGQRGLDRAQAVRVAMLEAGPGMVRTSLILMAGFSVLGFASYAPLSSGGLLLTITLAAAIVADLVMTPAMAAQGLFDAGEGGKVRGGRVKVMAEA